MIAEALAVIDQALGSMMSRELVSSNEVADLLLDVRSALTRPARSSSAGTGRLGIVLKSGPAERVTGVEEVGERPSRVLSPALVRSPRRRRC